MLAYANAHHDDRRPMTQLPPNYTETQRSTRIGLALSQPTNVWKLYYALARIVSTVDTADAHEIASGVLMELEFGTKGDDEVTL